MKLREPSSNTFSIAVLVISYGSSRLLERNLTRVSDAGPGLSIYVVDNWSDDVNRSQVEELCRRYHWTGLYPGENLGFGGGCNLAADQAIADGHKLLLLLNPDATIDLASIHRLSAVVTRDPMCLAAPTVQSSSGATWSAGVDLILATGEMRSWAKREEPPDSTSILPWLTGACMMINRTLWERAGGFDRDYFLYWEDVDLSARVLEAGGSLRLVEGAIAIHDEGGTHAGTHPARAKSSLYYYYNARNRLLYAAKHLSRPEQRRWWRSSAAATYRILLRGGRRQFLKPHQNIWPALRGLWDGRREMSRLG